MQVYQGWRGDAQGVQDRRRPRLDRVRGVGYGHRHDGRAAGQAIRGIYPGQFLDGAALRRHRLGARHHPQARAHDGRRRDGDERAGQGFAVHCAPAGRLNAMNLTRRQFLHLAAGAAALPAVSRTAWPQAYPSRPVRWIVGFAAGGGNDITARLMGQWLTERLGRPFIMENRPGAGTNIAAEAVVNAPADGYTLFFANVANAVNATLYEKLNFDFIRDITPVAGIMRVPNILVVSPSVPAKTVPELIAYAKANPGRVNMASAGIGTTGHLAGELFQMM